MKVKVLASTALLAISNFAAANGGLNIDNVTEHMNAVDWVNIQAERQEIAVQGPLDRFQDYTANTVDVVDVNQFKQNYDGQT